MKDLGRGVYTIESAIDLMPGVSLPLRATILRDRSGGLVVVSPVSGVSDWAPALRALGEVRNIVAPNGFHHLYVQPAWDYFPKAKRWASAALQRKRPDFPSNVEWLRNEAPIAIAPGVTAYAVLGMKPLQEWVFFHEESKTLVVTDLLFHILEPGFGLGLFQRLFGTYRTLAVSKLFVRARRDRAAYEASLRTIQALPIERLVMAHGQPILEGAGPRVRAALEASP